MGFIQGLISLLGRVVLASIFLFALRNHIPQFEGINQALAFREIPSPQIVHIVLIGFVVLGSVSLILGFKARLGATMLLIFLGFWAYYFHDFWHLDGSEREQQLVQFAKSVGLMGAMLFIIANGPGAWSIDRFRQEADSPLR